MQKNIALRFKYKAEHKTVNSTFPGTFIHIQPIYKVHYGIVSRTGFESRHS